MRRRLLAHALEFALLGTSLIVMAITIITTLSVSLSPAPPIDDLTYSGAVNELALLMQATGRDQLAELVAVEERVGDQRVVVDSVRLTASSSLEPSVAKGGFIADQTDAFNAHAMKRTVIEEALGGVVNAEAPSMWRTEVADDGGKRLAARPNPSLLTVRSPWADREWREVRTSDWHRGGGLLGLAGGAAVTGQVRDGGRVQLNGQECTVRVAPSEQSRLLYCGSALASDVARFFDLGVKLSDSELGIERVYPYRPAEAWVNGVRKRLTPREGAGAASGGDLLDVSRVGTMLLSLADHGSVAAKQWINGRHAMATSSDPALGSFAQAGRSRDGSARGQLEISLDAALSTDLEREARRFVTAQSAGLRRAVFVVMDIRTGEVRAIVEPTRGSSREPFRAFEPLLVGSVVKPVLAAAILDRRPDLLALSVPGQGSSVDAVAGVKLAKAFGTSGGCNTPIDVVEFLRCSSNQFAAELLIRSLDVAPGTTLIPRDALERSAVGAGLAEVFDVDALAGRTSGRTSALWSDGSSRSLWPWESRPWIVFPNANGTPTDWVARYAFGGWENRWTLLGIAEAYARIATGREVRATLNSQKGQIESAQALPARALAALIPIRRGLSRVGIDGTARGTTGRLHEFLPADTSVLMKTGTLNEDTDQFKALSIVFGKDNVSGSGASLQCGLVVVSYFEFLRQPRGHGPLPPVHLNFATGNLGPVIGRHWERVSGCGPAIPGATR